MSIDYVSRQDVDDFFMQKELPLVEGDSGVKERKIDLANKMTKAEINKFLKEGGYKAPLTEQVEVDEIIDISLPVFKYYLLSNQGQRTEQIEKDYQYARSMLKRIAENKIDLIDIPMEEAGKDQLLVLKMDFY